MLLSSLLPVVSGGGGATETPGPLGVPYDTKQFVGGQNNDTIKSRLLAYRAAYAAYKASVPYSGINVPGGLSREGDFSLTAASTWQSIYTHSGKGVITFLAVVARWLYGTGYNSHQVYLDAYIDGNRVAYDNEQVNYRTYQYSIFPIIGGIIGNSVTGDFLGFVPGYRPFNSGFEIKAYDNQSQYLSSVKYTILVGGYSLT